MEAATEGETGDQMRSASEIGECWLLQCVKLVKASEPRNQGFEHCKGVLVQVKGLNDARC